MLFALVHLPTIPLHPIIFNIVSLCGLRPIYQAALPAAGINVWPSAPVQTVAQVWGQATFDADLMEIRLFIKIGDHSIRYLWM